MVGTGGGSGSGQGSARQGIAVGREFGQCFKSGHLCGQAISRCRRPPRPPMSSTTTTLYLTILYHTMLYHSIPYL